MTTKKDTVKKAVKKPVAKKVPVKKSTKAPVKKPVAKKGKENPVEKKAGLSNEAFALLDKYCTRTGKTRKEVLSEVVLKSPMLKKA